MSTSVGRIVAERNHRTLLELVLKPGNDVCADCKARAPRWASHNLGIFICVNCASIHRKIGTHITKVKSITLDEWTKEQVEVMKEKGNINSNALYNPDEARNPPPTNMIDSERDSELERFIRSKYEFKRFISSKSASASQHLTVNSRAAPALTRPRSTPLTNSAQIEPPGPPLPPKTPENMPLSLRPLATMPSFSQNLSPTRSISQPLPPPINSDKLTTAPLLRQPVATQSSIQKPVGQAWEDLISLQAPSRSSSLPLQYSPASTFAPFPSQPQVLVQQPTLGNAPNPFMNLPFGQANITTSLAHPVPVPQFPLVSVPLPSPMPHLGSTNPFNQAPMASSPVINTNGTAFTNPFSSSSMPVSMSISASPTPSPQPVATFPTGLPYVQPQMSTPAPVPPFLPTPFSMPGTAHNPFGPPGQMPLSASGATNPFSAMQLGQTGFPGTPQTAFGTTAFLSQQQQQQQQQQQLGLNGFGGWAGQGAQGTF